jgi:hypothetical protein
MSPWKTRSAAAGLGLLGLGGASLYLWGNILSKGPPPLAAPVAGVSIASDSGPLFRLGNPYVDARSAWFRTRFDAELERALAEGPVGPVRAAARVHRTTFTDGPAFASLGTELEEYRAEVEREAVESSFSFEVRGADALKVLLCLVFADVHGSIEGGRLVERRNHFPPIDGALPGLEAPPTLLPSQYLCHERRIPSEPLALPTSLYYACQVERARGMLVIRYEAFRNTGDENHAPIHIDSGQYVIGEKDGVSSVRFLCFYSGQKIPPFFEGVAERMARESYLKFAEAVQRLAPAWSVPEEAAAWARRALSPGDGSARR